MRSRASRLAFSIRSKRTRPRKTARKRPREQESDTRNDPAPETKWAGYDPSAILVIPLEPRYWNSGTGNQWGGEDTHKSCLRGVIFHVAGRICGFSKVRLQNCSAGLTSILWAFRIVIAYHSSSQCHAPDYPGGIRCCCGHQQQAPHGLAEARRSTCRRRIVDCPLRGSSYVLDEIPYRHRILEPETQGREGGQKSRSMARFDLPSGPFGTGTAGWYDRSDENGSWRYAGVHTGKRHLRAC